MTRPYESFVKELLAHLDHQKRHRDLRKPVYVYIKQDNMPTFFQEAKLQFELQYSGMVVKEIECIERWLSQHCGLLFFIIMQPIMTAAHSYVRYEAVGPTVIFADFR
jgi:hypothetical protein